LTELLSVKLPNWINSASLNFIQVEMNLPPNIVVSADRVFLEIILDNLVSNAIKYGRLTGVIKFEWDPVNNAMSVSDDGIGMSKEQHSKIFNRFYRIDESRSNEIKGAGLGLAIVKKMCDLQNIEISVKSTLNIGSTFTLTFRR
jgi:signal transduction histidine kinase